MTSKAGAMSSDPNGSLLIWVFAKRGKRGRPSTILRFVFRSNRSVIEHSLILKAAVIIQKKNIIEKILIQRSTK
jgi:hypothetical protein